MLIIHGIAITFKSYKIHEDVSRYVEIIMRVSYILSSSTCFIPLFYFHGVLHLELAFSIVVSGNNTGTNK